MLAVRQCSDGEIVEFLLKRSFLVLLRSSSCLAVVGSERLLMADSVEKVGFEFRARKVRA